MIEIVALTWLSMGIDTICNVGGLDDHCARSAQNFLSCYLKCHKNALLRRNSHQFGSLDTNQQFFPINIM